jgi:hypothetical protein
LNLANVTLPVPNCFTCRTSFKDVGKGWYNLAESNFEAYRFSKLRRFLGLVRFGMEDTLRYLVEGSIAKFVTFMQVGGLDAAATLATASVLSCNLQTFDSRLHI